MEDHHSTETQTPSKGEFEIFRDIKFEKKKLKRDVQVQLKQRNKEPRTFDIFSLWTIELNTKEATWNPLISTNNLNSN